MSIIHEKSFYPNLYTDVINELNLEYINFFKRYVQRIDIDDINAYPIISKIINNIQTNYSVVIQGVFVNLYYNGTNYAPYHKDSYGGSGVFTLSIGGSREFLTKHDKTKLVTKYTLEDGDLLFFNNEFNDYHKHSIPIRKRMNSSRISIVCFV